MMIEILTHGIAFSAGGIAAILFIYFKLMNESPEELEERYGKELGQKIWKGAPLEEIRYEVLNEENE